MNSSGLYTEHLNPAAWAHASLRKLGLPRQPQCWAVMACMERMQRRLVHGCSAAAAGSTELRALYFLQIHTALNTLR
jgi:hypothetical protein